MMFQGPMIDSFRKSLQIFHLALTMGLLIFTIMAAFIVSTQGGLMEAGVDYKQATDILIYIVPLITLISIFAGFAFFRKRLQYLQQLEDESAKLNSYRSITIIRYAIFEGAAFWGLASYFLTGIIWFLPYPLLMILIFILLRPTRARIEKDLFLER